MSDYNSYRFMGFWFQPDPVSMDNADPFYHNHYLENYWNENNYTQSSSSNFTSIFDNYFNFNYDNSLNNYENTGSPFDAYFNIGSNNTQISNGYESVLDNYRSQMSQFGVEGTTNTNNTYNSFQTSGTSANEDSIDERFESLIGDDGSYFNPLFI